MKIVLKAMINKRKNVQLHAILMAVGQTGKNGQCAVHLVAKFVHENAIIPNHKMTGRSVLVLKPSKWTVPATSANEMRLLWTRYPISPPWLPD